MSIWDYSPTSNVSGSVRDCIVEARRHAIENGMSGSMELRIELEPGDLDEARTLGEVRFEDDKWWLLYVDSPAMKLREAAAGEAALGEAALGEEHVAVDAGLQNDDGCLSITDESVLSLRRKLAQTERERDEARAEVERLRAAEAK